MNIYKLKYNSKEEALSDLISKSVYIQVDNDLIYGEGIHSIVEIGLIILENGVYDNELNEITPPIYVDDYHYDVMSENEIDFGSKSIVVNNPIHSFFGHISNTDILP
jgi:hypothetical protein